MVDQSMINSLLLILLTMTVTSSFFIALAHRKDVQNKKYLKTINEALDSIQEYVFGKDSK